MRNKKSASSTVPISLLIGGVFLGGCYLLTHDCPTAGAWSVGVAREALLSLV